MRIKVSRAPLGTMQSYRFVVILARYQGKWVFCRHKARTSYEFPGGHIEPGETPRQAAKRELFEETGAREFDLEAAFDYSVSRSGEASCGQVFMARVREMGQLPESEIGEVVLMGNMPENMTYPKIQPGCMVL